MNENLRNFILELANNNMRIDGRKGELRDISVNYDISKNAEGSVEVIWGKTKLMVGTKMSIMTPFPDRPDDGIMMTGAEFCPISSPDFNPGPPNEHAIEFARVIDRGIRESGMIDVKKLKVADNKVWGVFIDIYVFNHDGNLIDAGALGVAAALMKTKIPKLNKDNEVLYGEWTNKKLPLTLTTTTTTVTKIGEKIIQDATKEEEEVADARMTFSVSDTKIHGAQKGGEGLFTQEEILKAADIAFNQRKQLLKVLE